MTPDAYAELMHDLAHDDPFEAMDSTLITPERHHVDGIGWVERPNREWVQ